MLTFQNLYFKSVASFNCQQCSSFSRSEYFMPVCVNALDLNGRKKAPSGVEITDQGTQSSSFVDTKVSPQLPGLMDGNGTLMNGQYSAKSNHVLDYETAMEALSSLITRKKRGDRSPVIYNKNKKLERMHLYVEIMGLEEHLSDLKIIHVAGTKGKGSTCSFCESILRECGFRTGMFTSPHLIDVRERFRLEGVDITEEKFLLYFWECWNRLKENVTADLPMPRLFEFLTLMAFKVFVSEQVDVAIIEVGLGGDRDSTNVIKNPIVCGVTSLGMDHMESLGNTIGEIASQKAGIFKPQVPAFTVPQLPSAMDALQEKAQALNVPLEVVAPLDFNMLKGAKLSLSGDHQFTNAGLAVALCRSWLQKTGNWDKLFPNENSLPEAFVRGLSTARLSGRAQIVHDSFSTHYNSSGVNGRPSGDLIFYLDGAHSPESMEACAKWFCSAAKDAHNEKSPPNPGSKTVNGGKNSKIHHHLHMANNAPDMISKKILLFNCMDVRDPEVLLSSLFRTCASSDAYFSNAIFVPSISKYNKVTSSSSSIPSDIEAGDLSWQMNIQRVWQKILHGKDVSCNNYEIKPQNSTPFETVFVEDGSTRGRSNGSFSCSTVVSSLPLAINWLRNYVKENPSSRVQVLVTGSLHLVGDVLKLLRR